MNFSSRVVRQILLLSLMMIIAPMVAFPELFGTSVAKASLLNACVEILFYCGVLFAFYRHRSLLSLFRAGLICFVYRLALGVMLGFFIIIMYSMTFRISMTLALFGYLPGVLLHVIATPFILRGLFSANIRVRSSMSPEPGRAETAMSGGTSLVATKNRRPNQVQAYRRPQPAKPSTNSSRTEVNQKNGFDHATNHIGVEGSVVLAVLVDPEGLCLSRFSRGDVDPEDYAPFARQMFEQMQPTLERCQIGSPERIDLILGEYKVFLAKSPHFDLLVLAGRQADDLLGIRVGQGLEIAKKYYTERYGEKSPATPEKAYV